jgi:hypothetical protein
VINDRLRDFVTITGHCGRDNPEWQQYVTDAIQNSDAVLGLMPCRDTGPSPNVLWEYELIRASGLPYRLLVSSAIPAASRPEGHDVTVFDEDDAERAVSAAIDTLLRRLEAARQWPCLILMPYGGSHDHFYDHTIAPAVREVGFHPHRIDRDAHVGRIFDLFTSHLKDSRAVILDATGLNFNVMHELGYANAVGIRPLIITRDPVDEVAIRKLPFYLSEIKLVAVMAPGEELKLKERIQSFLKELAPRSGKVGDGAAG